jgi:hypothetical protein
VKWLLDFLTPARIKQARELAKRLADEAEMLADFYRRAGRNAEAGDLERSAQRLRDLQRE